MTDTKDLTPERVAEWIRAQPDLLCRYPDLIDILELPSSGDVASLMQHQLSRLRRRNEQLEGHLQQLSAIAGENERLMQRLHQLTLALMSSASDAAFVDLMTSRLQQDFQADNVRLHLLDHHADLASHPSVIQHGSEVPDWLLKLIERSAIKCGRLTREKLGTLFPDGADVASAALVPLAGGGLLAVGSAREDHFHPGIGTLFLELLGSTVAWRLKPAEQDDRKRA